MFNSIFRSIFPKAPPSIPPAITTEIEVQRAIISALAAYIQRDGDRILSVKVPGYTGVAPDARFSVPNVADFAVEVGLDVYGSNVNIEANPYRPAQFTANTIAVALNEMVANTASVAVEATTITTKAD